MTSLSTMLKKSSVFMMVLLAAASLIGIADIYQYVEGQGPPAATPQPKPQQALPGSLGATIAVTGSVTRVEILAFSDGKVCLAGVKLPSDRPNNLGEKPGETIEVLSPDESFCTLFGLSKIGKTPISFRVEKLTTLNVLPLALRNEFPPVDEYPLYRVWRVGL